MTSLTGGALLAAVAMTVGGQATAVEWRVSLWGERRPSTEHVHKLADLVEERTGGGFSFAIDYGGLSRNVENLDGISIGAFEMAQFCAGYHADKNPSLMVLELPLLGIDSLEESLAVSRAVYRHPAVEADLERWKARLLMPTPTLHYGLAGTGEARDGLHELEGLRVQVPAGIGKPLEMLGALPTPGTAVDAHGALESGIVDAVALAQDGHASFGTIELADWWTANLDLGALNCPIAVNAEAYDALSLEHREALNESVDEALQHYLATYGTFLDDWAGRLSASGVRRVDFPEADLVRFGEAAAHIRDQWIDAAEVGGIPRRELYDLVRRTLAAERSATN